MNMKNGIKRAIAFSLSTAMAASGLVLMQKSNEVDIKAASEYTLVWSDEFDGTSLNRDNWNVEVNGNGGGNNELQYYTDREDNIKVEDGVLKIIGRKESYSGKNYTSGRITTKDKKTFKYGKIEAKLRIPSFQGSWPAFWMLGNNFSSVGWPKCGEIDIMEHINTGNSVVSNLHWSYNNSQADTKNATWFDTGDITDWHVYGVEWNANQMKFYCDNNVYQTYKITSESEMEEFRAKQFIILNFAIGGNWPGFNIDNSVFTDSNEDNNTYFVDWVRVYQTQDQINDAAGETEYTGKFVSVSENELEYAKGPWVADFNSNLGGAGTLTTNSSELKDGVNLNISSVGIGKNAAVLKLEDIPYYTDNILKLTCYFNSDVAKKITVRFESESDGMKTILYQKEFEVAAGRTYLLAMNNDDNIYIPEGFNEKLNMYVDLGWRNGDTIAKNSAANISITKMNLFCRTTRAKENEYKAHQKIVEPETTTTTTTTTTTPAPTTTVDKNKELAKKIAKSKVSISKISPKKKSDKKIKVTLKSKVDKASGYSVRVYSSLKLAKKNKSAIVKYTVSKNSKTFYVKSSKLKNKKTLYVRVRAYAKIKGKKVYADKWSKYVKVKVK